MDLSFLSDPLVLVALAFIFIAAICIFFLAILLYYGAPLMGVIRARMKKWDVALVRQQNGSAVLLPARYRQGALEFKNGAALFDENGEVEVYKLKGGVNLFIVDDLRGIVTNPSVLKAFSAVRNKTFVVKYKDPDGTEKQEVVTVRDIRQIEEILMALDLEISELEKQLNEIKDEKEREEKKKEIERLKNFKIALLNVEVPVNSPFVRLSEIVNAVRYTFPMASVSAFVDEKVNERLAGMKDPGKWLKWIMVGSIAFAIVIVSAAIAYTIVKGAAPTIPVPVQSPPPSGGGQIVIK